MFMMFAMTTDSVGKIIPEVIKEFHLSNTAAGAFHYAPMTAIALAGIFLGYLADKLGRKKTIILGLVLFALNSYLFAVGKAFLPSSSCCSSFPALRSASSRPAPWH
jgi:FHS family L-fucose permease-like MFS transporter